MRGWLCYEMDKNVRIFEHILFSKSKKMCVRKNREENKIILILLFTKWRCDYYITQQDDGLWMAVFVHTHKVVSKFPSFEISTIYEILCRELHQFPNLLTDPYAVNTTILNGLMVHFKTQINVIMWYVTCWSWKTRPVIVITCKICIFF